MFSRFLTFFFLAVALAATGQPQHFTLTEATMKVTGNRAVLVSNQYGVLRYAKLLEKGSAVEGPLSFDVLPRLGEQLALTLVREIDGGGIFGFENTTYCNLADGVVVDAPVVQEDKGEYRQVEFSVIGVEGAEEVIVLSPLEDGVEYHVDRGRLALSFRALTSADIYVLFKLKGHDGYLYYYSPMQPANRIALDVKALKSGVLQQEIGLPTTQVWDGYIKAYRKGSDIPCYVYNSSQLRAITPRTSIRAFLPPGQDWDHFDLVLTNLQSDKYGYYNRYQDSLPDALGTLDFDPLFTDHQSKAFRFKTTEKEAGQYYQATYTYSLRNQMPARWQVFGQVGQPGEVDFFLPDLPETLLNILPELHILPNPDAITKAFLRCARCNDYTFQLAPAALQQEEWRLKNGVVERGQWTEF